jgi:hypothetical protein
MKGFKQIFSALAVISAYATKNQHKLDLQASQEKSNNISIKTKQLSEQIKYLLSIMP